MAKDQRLYGKFTLDFPENQKILPLSDAAFRCLVEATLWSRKQETDGWLPTRLAIAKWSPSVLEELSTNDPDKPSLIPVENGWLIRDYADHQDTKEEIQARRERNKLNGQKGGLAKGKQGAKRPASKSVSENVAEKEEEEHNSTTDKSVVERPRKRASRLPNDWRPDQDVIDQMRSEHPHVDYRVEHAKFCDYWQSKSGKDATKLDWNATWRNWIRRAAENTRPHLRAVSNGSHMSTSDRRFAEIQALKDPQEALE